MKLLLFIGYLLIVLFSFRCASTESRQQFLSSEDYYKLKDSLFLIDQKKSFHPKRTIKYLQPILDSLSSAVTNVLNEQQLKPKVNFRSLSFVLLPSGDFICDRYWDYIKVDSLLSAEGTENPSAYYQPDSTIKESIDSLSTKYRTDSLPDCKSILWLTGNVKETPSGYVYNFKDTSCYLSQNKGGRSRVSIMRVVMKKMKTLRHAYNKAVTVEPELMGKITVKFAINEYGHIIFAEIADSDIAIKEPQLCNEFLRIIRLWKFDRIKKKGDITESDILVF